MQKKIFLELHNIAGQKNGGGGEGSKQMCHKKWQQIMFSKKIDPGKDPNFFDPKQPFPSFRNLVHLSLLLQTSFLQPWRNLFLSLQVFSR